MLNLSSLKYIIDWTCYDIGVLKSRSYHDVDICDPSKDFPLQVTADHMHLLYTVYGWLYEYVFV